MIPEPHATLQGAVTWRNQCHDRATLQGVIIPSAMFFAIFYFFFVSFKCSLGFDQRRLSYRLRYTCICRGKYLGCVKIFPLGGVQGAQGQERDLHRIFAFQWDI